MVSVFDLWLPILASGVFVFIVSSVIHMAIPIHKGDYAKLPGEADVLKSMRDQSVRPGQYMFPCADSMKEMATPEMIEKLNQGPVGFLTVVDNGPMNMGKALVQWFVYSLVVGFCIAYVAGMGLAAGADSMVVFRLTAAVGILAYGIAGFVESIWKGVPWGVSAKFLFDGFLYGMATGGAFAWLWPAAI